MTRRDFSKTLVILGLQRGTAASSARIGVCTYSFRDLPRKNGDAVGPVLEAMRSCDAHITELFCAQLEPERSATFSRDDLRKWRLETPLSHFVTARKHFDQAGVEIYAYSANFRSDFTDEEIDRCFEQAKTLQARVLASSTQISMLPRLKPIAAKHRLPLAVHGHSDTRHPDEFSSPESFQKALDDSDWFRVNLDIGHFTAAGFDAVAYIREHHERISHLHIKDRKKNNGPNEPFGSGDTPIKQVLALLAEQHYPIPALVEYEYPGPGTPVEEVQKCLAYMGGRS